MLYNKIYTRFCSVDIPMLLCSFTLCSVSLYSLYTLSMNNSMNRLTGGVSRQTALTQAVSILIGIIVFVTIILAGKKTAKRLSPAVFIICIVLCALTLTPLGVTVDDDRAWLSLAGISFQPSELLKIGYIMCASFILSSVGNKRIRYTLFCLCSTASAVIIFLQRDIGTLMIFVLIAVCMHFCSGSSKKLWALGILLSPAFLYIVWRIILNSDQRARILSAIDPSLDPYGIGYQQISASNAIAEGGFTGRLFGPKGSFVYVSSAHNDFILSFIAQLFGSIGIFAVCMMLCFVIVRSAPKSGIGSYVYYLRSGVFMMLASQAIINTAMNLSLFPVVGITLPFVSAGGSSVVSAFSALALISLPENNETSPEVVI